MIFAFGFLILYYTLRNAEYWPAYRRLLILSNFPGISMHIPSLKFLPRNFQGEKNYLYSIRALYELVPLLQRIFQLSINCCLWADQNKKTPIDHIHKTRYFPWEKNFQNTPCIRGSLLVPHAVTKLLSMDCYQIFSSTL